MTQESGMVGFAPTVAVGPINPEADKYRRMWETEEYRAVSPGEQIAMTFLSQARMPPDSEVIDFGAGTGRGALMLALFGRAKVRMLDFASNCLDPEVREGLETQGDRLKFAMQDLTEEIQYTAPYGYCTDVMEHIPPRDVKRVLTNILAAAEHVFFSISCVDDVCGAAIGEPLHLTVKPAAWWIEQLQSVGAHIQWSQSCDEAVMIYCSAWAKVADCVVNGQVNVDQETIDKHVRENVCERWTQVTPHDKQDREVILLAGGPSMRRSYDEIAALRAAGAALVTVNGAYNWALDQGLAPSAQIVLDARPFNSRFTERIHETCKYLVASQCDPNVLVTLPRERTLMWHSGLTDEMADFVREQTGVYFPVPGGSTVVLRAIPLLRMLGFSRIHIFGFDSCLLDGEHHSYKQSENDNEPVFSVTCGGKVFQCTPWMASQATEFMDLVGFLGDEVELEVYGDGLIAHILRTGAKLDEVKP